MERPISKLESLIKLPSKIDYEDQLNQQNPVLIHEIVADTSVLTCGCLVSENLATALSTVTDGFICPVCLKINTKLLAPVQQLRDLYLLIEDFKKSETFAKTNSSQIRSRRRSSSKKSQTINFNQQTAANKDKIGLLNLFYQIAKDDDVEVASTSYNSIAYSNSNPNSHTNLQNSPTNVEDWIATMNDSTKYTPPTNQSFITQNQQPAINLTKTKSSISFNSNKTTPISISPNNKSNLTKQLNGTSISHNNIQISSKDEKNEYNFVKCFPMYRKQYQYNTHPKFFKPRNKLYIATSISPDLKKFVLLGEKKWELYHLAGDPKSPPVLKFVGKSTGECGINFDNLNKADDWKNEEEKKRLMSWEFLYCCLSKKYLVIAGTKGMLRVLDIERGGIPVYTHYSSFPIRCVDISSDEKLIACGITGKEKNSGTEQTLIALHNLDEYLIANNPNNKAEPVTITLPYRDPVNTINFSADSQFLSCSTALESRFMVISIKNAQEPRLVMKSLRSLDTSLESEGITDVKFFPDNKLMVITSVAFNSSPIIIKTRIDSINGLQEIAQPVMLMRLDKVGSTIHKTAVSPRGDSVAFLDRNGMIYLMTSPGMDHENQRFVIVAEVANAYRVRESASIRFSDDGYRLYAVDRKGILYIQDFAGGLPQDHDVMKCKVID